MESPVTIEQGPVGWQVLQQNEKGVASIVLGGRWSTLIRRKKPEVRVRVVREGSFSAIGTAYDWVRAKTVVDQTIAGEFAGRRGTWKLALKELPRGGPYRIETTVGSVEDAVEWRRTGDVVHFLGVGDLWLIAGQSNAEGYGREALEDPSEIGIHQLGDKGWELAAHGRNHHPWLAFAKALKRELGYPIGLIPTAVGGSPVSRWDPGQKGDLFAAMAQRLATAGGRIKGCVWYQGESDTGEADFPKYKVRFGRFLKGLRQAVRQPELPVITVQLNRVLGPRKDRDGWEAMREIQRQLSHEQDGVFVIPIFEAGLSDMIHIGSLGNLLLADRAANTALGGMYGRDIHYKHPECVSARQVTATAIDLRFANVIERLDYAHSVGHGDPFCVVDTKGEVPMTRHNLPRKDVFRIHLARPLSGRATVTGAPGTCPPYNVPRDISGYRAMLGFTRDVET